MSEECKIEDATTISHLSMKMEIDHHKQKLFSLYKTMKCVFRCIHKYLGVNLVERLLYISKLCIK